MRDSVKIGRNDPCPCGKREKYKNCCLGKVPWPEIIKNKSGEGVRHLSIRGKNLCFMNSLAAALQLDNLPSRFKWADVKRAVSPDAVRFIHEAVLHYWPDQEDLSRVLGEEREDSSALYIGTYNSDSIARGVARHSLYSESILLVDPFMYASSVREQFNPIEHPEQHRSSTLSALRVWWQLAPWIESGIVGLIRVPGDFDPFLALESLQKQRERSDANPELQKLADEEAEGWREVMEGWPEFIALVEPDWYLKEKFRETKPDASDADVAKFIKGIERARENHPFYVEGERSQFITMSTGANYEMARMVSGISGSHLITDIRYRWKEIEIDRAAGNIDNGGWSAFAKAFADINLKFIQETSLDNALRLRKEGRLHNMRTFLRSVWKKVGSGDSFSSERVEDLAAELQQHVREAETEWRKIDEDLLKWGGIEFAGILASGTLLGSGAPGWLAASVAVAGATQLAYSSSRRKSLGIRYPGAFFLGPRYK